MRSRRQTASAGRPGWRPGPSGARRRGLIRATGRSTPSGPPAASGSSPGPAAGQASGGHGAPGGPRARSRARARGRRARPPAWRSGPPGERRRAVPVLPDPAGGQVCRRGTTGCRATNRWNGRVVWMPPISVSSSARRRRSMAASRSPAWTMILAMRLSYSAGTRSPASSRGVDPDAGTGRHHPAPDPAGRRAEVARRILGGDPDLDRVPGRVGGPVGGGQRIGRQRPARGQPELLADDVEAGHELGHAVLDLEPGVDLEEVGRPVRDRAGTRRWRRCAGRPRWRP